jgi:leader peptidase (prepilin peptidase) / N-methyltransferase
MFLLPIIIFGVGLIIGSFLNVVILRMNTGRSYVTGRSKCARCARTLAWYELIPVFSYLGLRGKCRTCNTSISHQYPIVELLTGISFLILYTKIVLPAFFAPLSILTFAFLCVIAGILIVITIYDLKHKIIPDQMVYSFILLSLISIAWKEFTIPEYSFFAALLNGLFLALPFFLLWYLSKGRLMGFGDVKLALGIGWLLGLQQGFAALLLAFWIGGIFGLGLLAVSRKHSMKSQIPFGPFLILGMVVAGLWGITIQSLFPIW